MQANKRHNALQKIMRIRRELELSAELAEDNSELDYGYTPFAEKLREAVKHLSEAYEALKR